MLLFLILSIIPNSVSVDGTLHRNQMAAYYKDISSIYSGVNTQNADSHLKMDSAFVARDGHNVYIRILNGDTLWFGNYGDLFVVIDTGSTSGGLYSPCQKHVVFCGNFPDYIIHVNDNNDCILYKWGQNGWVSTTTSLLCNGAGVHPDFEITLPRDSIGNPDIINITAYTTYKNTGDGVLDYSVGDSAYSVITLDGIKEADYKFLGVSDQSGGDGANLDSLFATWDSTALYLFITTANTASWDVAYGVGLDVDELPNSGYYTGGNDAWGRKIDFGNTESALPFAVDYEVYFYFSGVDDSITSSNLCRWNGDAWNYSGTDYAYTTINGLKTIEIKVPWDSIGGIHKKILLSAWIAGNNGGSSAVDAIPHDDQISNSADEWTDEDTIYTSKVLILDKPVAQDAISPLEKSNGRSADTVLVNNTINLNTYPLTFGYYDYSNWGDTAVGFLYPIDGVVDTGGFYEDEMLLCSDSKNAWLTWNADSIYIGYTYQAFDAAQGGTGDLFIYFQTDSVAGITHYQDEGSHYAINWWNGDSIVLPLNMDYAIAVEDGNYYSLYRFNNTKGSWESVATNQDSFPGVAFVGYDDVQPENGVTEISISQSALSNPSYMGVSIFAHTDNTGVIFGVSPTDSAILKSVKTMDNNDNMNDTLKYFWGIYRVEDSGIPVNSIRDYYVPTLIDENHKKCVFDGSLLLNGNFLSVNSGVLPDELLFYSVTGRLVKKVEVWSSKQKINTIGLPDGIYIARLRKNGENLVFIKLQNGNSMTKK